MKYLIFISYCLVSFAHADLEYKDVVNEYKEIEASIGSNVKKRKVKQKSYVASDRDRLNIEYVDKNETYTIDSYKKQYKSTSTPDYKLDVERQRMLRKAKYLKKKHEVALLKLESWEDKKDLLKQAFEKKNRKELLSLGVNNEYAKRRAAKRRREYLRSLAVQEEHIVNREEEARKKYEEIQEEFLIRFAVPLTDEEMSGEAAPIVEGKLEKIQMLNEYINETIAWKECWEKVADFERVERVAPSLAKLFPMANLNPETIKAKKEENKRQMQSHVSRYQSIDLDYQSKYGLSIASKERAQMILDSLDKN